MALEPVLISALNQYVFCPRRCALMHVEGIWSDNEHTTIGALLHDHTDAPGYETDGDVTLLRALPLYSLRYGLVGKADIVEMRAGVPAPVEYKKGKRRQFDNDDIQLCAQALCLEEMFGVAVTQGCIYHAASKRRRQVVFDDKLRGDTQQTIEAVRRLLAEDYVPPAVLKPRCDGCSLRDVCLPELTGAAASVTRQEQYQRLLYGEG
jgi:CRISPR-associated exonuclease Cas4